jgi:hypothetical protein
MVWEQVGLEGRRSFLSEDGPPTRVYRHKIDYATMIALDEERAAKKAHNEALARAIKEGSQNWFTPDYHAAYCRRWRPSFLPIGASSIPGNQQFASGYRQLNHARGDDPADQQIISGCSLGAPSELQ